ncbi:MAG: FAD-binding oxidoreductase [Bryobacterales bacterium]|nr:FAD-binding oxidoreductase [Bryobacterales bacterium]
MQTLRPASIADLASTLRDAGASGKSIAIGGAFSKQAMGGPIAAADVTISTAALNRVLEYDPRDLTISVEAGLPYADLTRLLAEHRQMIPLDPPYAAQSTAGGVVAANCSGPRRRLYGAVRDCIIGMKFVTVDGEVAGSGGMVVKNVAGLDMAKIMVGSFGTLAAIAVVNFKTQPAPETTRTFLFENLDLAGVLTRRDAILKGVLQPAAIDMLSPAAALCLGRKGWILAVEAGGTAETVARYARELDNFEPVYGRAATEWWEAIREFTPAFLKAHPGGAVVRVSTTLQGIRQVLEQDPTVAAVVRAGNGLCYLYTESFSQAARLLNGDGRRVIEFAALEDKADRVLWPTPGSDFVIMERVKEMFDPHRLLNRGRLYGRI